MDLRGPKKCENRLCCLGWLLFKNQRSAFRECEDPVSPINLHMSGAQAIFGTFVALQMVGLPGLEASVTDAQLMGDRLNRFTGGKEQFDRVLLELSVITTSGLGLLHWFFSLFLTPPRVHEIRASLH